MAREPFKHLELNKRYEVVRAFLDYDRELHPVGETWWFLGHEFVPYHDGLSLWVSKDQIHELQIRMQWIAEEQAATIDSLADYIRPAPEEAN